MCEIMRGLKLSNNIIVANGNNNTSTARKLVIKNMCSKFEGCIMTDDLMILEDAVNTIHQGSSSLNVTYEDLYRIVENLCTHDMKQDLYYNLRDTVEKYLKRQMETLFICDDSTRFLCTLNRLWTDFCECTKLINNIYMYLDRIIINDKTFKNSIWNMHLLLFKNNIIVDNVKDRLIAELLRVIDVERLRATIDSSVLKSLIKMMIDLQIYEDCFEPEFLRNTDELYQNESVCHLKSIDIIDYLHYANDRIKEEERRLIIYLSAHTETPLMNIMNNRLIIDHLDKILYDSINRLIDDNRLDVLELLYNLLQRIPKSHVQLEKHLSQFIIKRGLAVVEDVEKDKIMIQFLLEFKDQIDRVISKCFYKNNKLFDAVKDAFKYFINQRHNKPAELLAKFVDSILKSKNLEEETEEILDKIMVIFRFIQGKDIFEAFYKKDLCKRLLVGRSSSQDAEYSMINKLKLECGSCFTAKLEGMFKDVRLSYDINSSFKQYLINNKCNFNFDMNINVLTNSYWPNFSNDTINLPEDMIQYEIVFQKFYLNTYNGRKLQWQPSLGSCILKARFNGGPKELQVSVFQTIVLLLFNAVDQISYKEIEDSTNLKSIELKRTLQSLACGKVRVLCKVPKGKDVIETDTFHIKKDFTDKLFRVKINQIQMRETVEEQKATEESVFQDRQFQIDAAIVRIMKQKKILVHNELISELYKTFDLPIKAIDFKKRIEQLIEREYIERDKENTNIYKYVA